MLWAARLQESRGWSGGSAKDRTETAAGAEGPRGRDQPAACRLLLSGRDSSDWPATMGIKLGINPFKNVPLSCSGLTESRMNLPGAETHW